MAGTNSELELLAEGPAIILVEPQLGENIGMVARAMANFGLAELRLVNPRDGWPSEKARSAASKADHVIDGTKVYPTSPAQADSPPAQDAPAPEAEDADLASDQPVEPAEREPEGEVEEQEPALAASF